VDEHELVGMIDDYFNRQAETPFEAEAPLREAASQADKEPEKPNEEKQPQTKFLSGEPDVEIDAAENIEEELVENEPVSNVDLEERVENKVLNLSTLPQEELVPQKGAEPEDSLPPSPKQAPVDLSDWSMELLGQRMNAAVFKAVQSSEDSMRSYVDSQITQMSARERV
jgi:hypothetical protein